MADTLQTTASSAKNPLVGKTVPQSDQQNKNSDILDGFSQFERASTNPDAKSKDILSGFSQFERVSTSPQNSSPIIQGAVKGATEGLSVGGGALAGARTGFLATAAIPIPGARIAGTLIGGGVGALAGYLTGELATKGLANINLPDGSPLTQTTINDVPRKDRAKFVFGEDIGAGVAFMGGGIGIAKAGLRTAGKSFVGKVVNGYLDAAAKTTKAFIAGESVATTGAAAGGATAETFAPGNNLARAGAEVTGGVIAPGRLVISAGSFLATRTRQLRQALSPAARETSAAKIVQDAYDVAGNDTELASKLLLDAAKHEPVVSTPAQILGDTAMTGLENALKKSSKEFSVEAEKKAAATITVFTETIKRLRSTGDPSALKEAADIQERYFRTLLMDKINVAKNSALEAAGKISIDNVDARRVLSEKAFEAADVALKQSREVEKKLWNEVQTNVPAAVDHITQTVSDMSQRLLPTESLPKIIVDEMKRLGEVGGKTDIGFLKLFRTRMNTLAREAGSNPERANEASIYGHLAEAALDDIDNVFKGENSAVLRTLGVSTEAYDTARRFSGALHDSFTNSFTGKNLAQGRRGLRLAPEALLKRAHAGGGEVTALRLRELEESSRFLLDQGRGSQDVIDNFNVMLDTQERFFAVVANDAAVNKLTGEAKRAAIANFKTKNPELIDRFPDVGKRLDEAAKSQKIAEDMSALAKNATTIMQSRAAFAKLAGTNSFENPIDAVKSAITGKNPVNELISLAKVAKKGGEDAVTGLQATLYDYATRVATTSDGLDFKKFGEVFFNPIGPNKQSLSELMKSKGVLNDSNIKALKTVIDKAEKLTKSASGIGEAVNVSSPLDGLSRLLARATGAKASTQVLGGGGGLIISSAGARFSEQILNKIPSDKVLDVLIAATREPKLMAALLTKKLSGEKEFNAAMALHSLLVRMGMMTVTPLGIAITPQQSK